ncbi:YbaB/EbfC family nucleoid-associated protein, partial [Patescibacteria group bacterium]|nr:YbaB/EbfC family nucleoid-associated protein [Patescibacteria group bacterium]
GDSLLGILKVEKILEGGEPMKKMVSAVVLFIACIFYLVPAAQADEVSEVKEQMKAMQEQMKAMQKKIEALEAQAPEAAVAGPRFAQSMEMVEGFKLGGEAAMFFTDIQKDGSTNEPEPHFGLDKICLLPAIQITEDISVEAALDIEEGGANLDELYFIFENMPLDSSLTVGKDDRFFKTKRFTERYPFAGTAFWRDEEIGILWETESDPFYTALSWSQGLELNTGNFNQDGSYDIMQDDGKNSNHGGIRQVSAGLGFAKELGESAKIDILGWGLYSKLSSADITFLKSNLTAYTSNDDNQQRLGANLTYEIGNFNIVTQYIDAEDGKLDRKAWFIQPSCKVELPVDWKYCKDNRFLVRYGELKVDNTESTGSTCTWDRTELTLAILTDIANSLVLKTEYTIDDEETGAGDVNNNELLIWLEYAW